MRAFWDEFTEIWESIRIEVCRYVPAEDGTVILWRFAGSGRDGIAVERDGAHFARVEDGMVVYLRSYGEWDQALADNGVEE
jgi:hypothetical protein